MKFSYFNSMPNDIPFVLGPTMYDKPAKPEMLGDQAYNYMAGVAADITRTGQETVHALAKKVPMKVPDSAKKAAPIDDDDSLWEATQSALMGVKDKFGVDAARALLVTYGQANKLFEVADENMRGLFDACDAKLKEPQA